MTALPITAKIAQADSTEAGEPRLYGQLDIGPGDVQITVYESLGRPGTVIIDIDRGDADDPEATKVRVAINDCYVDDTTAEASPPTGRPADEPFVFADNLTRGCYIRHLGRPDEQWRELISVRHPAGGNVQVTYAGGEIADLDPNSVWAVKPKSRR